MQHRYHIINAVDGDFVCLEKLEPSITGDGWHWAEQTRWLIPTTQMEEA